MCRGGAFACMFCFTKIYVTHETPETRLGVNVLLISLFSFRPETACNNVYVSKFSCELWLFVWFLSDCKIGVFGVVDETRNA